MKRIKMSFFALLLLASVVAFAAFKESKSSNLEDPYYWFINEEYVDFTSDENPPPGQCNATGSGCIEGFQSATPIFTYPGGTPTKTYAQNPN